VWVWICATTYETVFNELTERTWCCYSATTRP